MKAIYYVFSGTGNTKKICRQLIEESGKYGVESDLYMIKPDEEYPSPEEYDCVVIGYPVHAFNAPASVLKFLKRLSVNKGEKKPAYLVRTSGEPLGLNDASGILPAKILKKRGYCVLGEFSYVMPYNIIFRHSDGMAARMWQASLKLIERDAKRLAQGGAERPRVNVFKRAVSFTLRIEHPAMYVIGRTFRVSKKKCIGCGKCAKICPQKNITMKDGKPKFGGRCVACMGCAFGCPEDAVRPSLLNGWRVNGAYRFDGEPAGDDGVCNYCRRAYLRYFKAVEQPETPEE